MRTEAFSNNVQTLSQDGLSRNQIGAEQWHCYCTLNCVRYTLIRFGQPWPDFGKPSSRNCRLHFPCPHGKPDSILPLDTIDRHTPQ